MRRFVTPVAAADGDLKLLPRELIVPHSNVKNQNVPFSNSKVFESLDIGWLQASIDVDDFDKLVVKVVKISIGGYKRGIEHRGGRGDPKIVLSHVSRSDTGR